MKNKALLALILAVVLLIAGAFLPRIVGAVMDRSASNKMEFAQVSDIQLEFVQSEMPIEEILGILCNDTRSVEVPPDMTKHSAGDISRLAQQIITHYQDAALISHSVDVSTDLYACTPLLNYQEASGRRSNIFWHLILEPEDNSWRLEMVMDDRTGTLCSINYDYHSIPDDTKPSNGSTTPPTAEELKDVLYTFAEVLLHDLGGSFAELDLHDSSQGIAPSIDEDLASLTITWDDTHKEPCHIVFYTRENAFYTIFY